MMSGLDEFFGIEKHGTHNQKTHGNRTGGGRGRRRRKKGKIELGFTEELVGNKQQVQVIRDGKTIGRLERKGGKGNWQIRRGRKVIGEAPTKRLALDIGFSDLS